MQQIKYDDPQGAMMDLVRPVTRQIEFKMPDDYQGPTIPAVTQRVTFYREAHIADNGDKSFTAWHAEDPFWTIYRAPKITGLIPDQAEVPSKDVTVDTPGEQVAITYHHDHTEPVEDADDETEPAESVEKTPEVPAVAATKSFIANLEAASASATTPDSSTESEAMPEFDAAALQDQISAALNADDKPVTEQAANAPEPVKRPFFEPLLIPRKVLPVPFADRYQHLLQDPESALLLNRILTIGRLYRKDQQPLQIELFADGAED